jgi:hypothetical protein
LLPHFLMIAGDKGRHYLSVNQISARRFIVPLVALALGGVNAGCSFVFMDAVPQDHEKMPYFDCTSTYGLAVADGLFGLSGAIGAGMTLSQSKADFAAKNNGASRNAAAGTDIALAAVTVASGIYGVVQATRCDHAKAELQAKILAPTFRVPPPTLPGGAPASPAPAVAPAPAAPPPPVVVPAAPPLPPPPPVVVPQAAPTPPAPAPAPTTPPQ